jgi:hypothetical protein
MAGSSLTNKVDDGMQFAKHFALKNARNLSRALSSATAAGMVSNVNAFYRKKTEGQ